MTGKLKNKKARKKKKKGREEMLDNETINIPKLTAAAAHLLLKQIFSHHCPK